MYSYTRRILLLLCIYLSTSQVLSGCPYSDASLKKWSVASSWPSGSVPAANSDVVIPVGTAIILDVTPPALQSIIVDGGKLVWGDYDGLEITTSALISKNGGEIWVGSEDCLFTKKAYITLTGTAASTTYTGFGNKVLGVGAKGTLELHGASYSPTWTRLSVTHKPAGWKSPGLGRGMNVAVFDPSTGYFQDFKSFDTYLATNQSDALVTYLNTLANGAVISMVAADEASYKLTPAAVSAIQGIGSSLITQLKYRSGWACVGVKGSAIGTAVEDIKNETLRPTAVVVRTFSAFAVRAQAYNPYSGLIEVVAAGSPTIKVADNVNWVAGQQIVIASSDQDYTHAEQNEILQVINSKQLKLKNPILYTHWGNVENGVDERAEVGLLSRSIVVRGKQIDSSDTYGGHSKCLVNFTNVHMENVEFFQMGQDGVVGSYPVHFHMAFDVDSVGKYTKPTYVKNNAIWKSFNRCVTIHGTSGLLVQGNVAYDNLGHCYFFEDGSEQRNTLDRNLGLSTKYGNSILSDYDPARCTGELAGFCKGPATYWITNPNNILTNNVAAGSVQFGIWYVFPTTPTGLSAPYYPSLFIPYLPLGGFKNNVIHTSGTGLMVDDGIVSTQGPTYLGITGARYRPHQTSSLSSPRVIANFDDTTVHHTRERGIWLRGGDFRVNRAKLADNLIAITLASEGTMPNDAGSSQQILNSLIVGVTSNSFPAQSTFRLRGFEVYDGPVSIINTTFVNFPDNGKSSSAIAAKENNVWQIATTNEVKGAVFSNVFKRVYYQTPVGDGDRTNVFKDVDGSVTGKAGWSVVTALPIHQTKSCTDLTGTQAYACPDKYGQLFIMNRNVSGTNYNAETRWIITRDEKSTSPMNLTGIGQTPPSQYQPLVLIGKSYTLQFAHATPPNIGVQMTNFDASDNVRIGLCYPKNTAFLVRYKKGSTYTTLTAAANLAAVDANSNASTSYFWDNTNGLLFVKLIAQTNRNGVEYCGSSGCESIEITATGPNVGVGNGYCPTAYPTYAKTEPNVKH